MNPNFLRYFGTSSHYHVGHSYREHSNSKNKASFNKAKYMGILKQNHLSYTKSRAKKINPIITTVTIRLIHNRYSATRIMNVSTHFEVIAP